MYCFIAMESLFFEPFQGKSKLVRKIGVLEIRGKITITEERETTFGSSYRGGSKN